MQQQGEGGFTVVELLIALSLLSVLVVTLAAVFGTGQRLHASVSEMRDELDELAMLRQILSETLGQLNSGSPEAASVTGDSRGLALMARTPRVVGATGAVAFELGPDADARGLSASWRGRGGDAAVDPQRRRIVSIEREVRFAYYAADTGWIEAWADSRRPPALVRVSVDGEKAFRASTLVFATRQLSSRCGSKPTDCRD
jgi:type II secretory pathway pseudopilin PulG